ncbi:predicted protein [Sclerotinia sclerotiorum 1980 UF-70]|uniref:Uncharacterized protein n=2 Tax=Sclerotinia sclerotiorum (strain ATCC 18683 / 1980 / Ss-1) TaxID=665079 RepID=A7E7T9_SCLS1|nr:predicted protein [Sclerotinia sclerotiorum 1980 UF-70]APA06169.1 hypothetical protein sscle_01g009390 [Sclerotinia sclerotiorum 1980 UF-70]EDN96441.1 predicted protein [Sclerotinia sclerotiorum 1980 UF-70]
METKEEQRKFIEIQRFAMMLFVEKSMSNEQIGIELHNVERDEKKCGPIEDSYLWGSEYRLGMQLEECGLRVMGFSEFCVRMVMRFVGGKQDVAVGLMAHEE